MFAYLVLVLKMNAACIHVCQEFGKGDLSAVLAGKKQ